MIRYVRELRLIPIALIASACLLALKTADLALHGSGFLTGNKAADVADIKIVRPMPEGTQPVGLSWAQQMFNFPVSRDMRPAPPANIAPRLADRGSLDITGSIDSDKAADSRATAKAETKPDAKPDGKTGPATVPAKDGTRDGKPSLPPAGSIIPAEAAAVPMGAERAILERLQERRQELDTRARELDIRESLIQGAEKRMEARLSELKEMEARIKVETGQKDDAEAIRFKSLVTMYENMKPRDAAKIFDRLDIGVLIAVASQINPRKMSDILAQMSPDTAERLTVELASKAQQAKPASPADLPKIQGQPIPQ